MGRVVKDACEEAPLTLQARQNLGSRADLNLCRSRGHIPPLTIDIAREPETVAVDEIGSRRSVRRCGRDHGLVSQRGARVPTELSHVRTVNAVSTTLA